MSQQERINKENQIYESQLKEKLENRLSLLIDSIKDDLVSLQGIRDKIFELRR